MRVLIAEDEPMSRRLLEKTLQRLGHEVVGCEDGRAAVAALLGETPPDIAILDWMMPKMDGVDVCRATRSRPTATPTYIILLTTKSGSDDVVTGLDAGANDYVTKPFNVRELEARVRAGMRVVELQKALQASKEQLQFQATHDALTGLLNRGAIMPALDRDLARAAREGTPTSLVIIDLDRFKSVNDTYGHPAGDAVLVEAARRLKSTLRASDAIGRYGGEEFLVLLPNCDAEGALIAAERLRSRVAAGPIVVPGAELAVTCSLGLVTLDPPATVGGAELIQAADQALLTAKSSGRNRACVATPPGLPTG